MKSMDGSMVVVVVAKVDYLTDWACRVVFEGRGSGNAEPHMFQVPDDHGHDDASSAAAGRDGHHGDWPFPQ